MSRHQFGGRSSRRRLRSRVRWAIETLEDRRLLSTIAALTPQNQLLLFDSERASVILGSASINGLQANESVLGIDVRPATGELYGLGSTGRLYVINPLTGAVDPARTLVLTADPTDTTDPFTALNGSDFGIDFNPVPDRLRVVSDAEQNLRINPATGTVITDGTLAYAAGTPHAGENPTIVDAAYTNNVAGATSTTLFVLDTGFHILARQDPPNDGTLTKVVPFGKEGANPVGFDIAPSGRAFVAVDALSVLDREFLLTTIDLATEADSSRGAIGDGRTAIRDIAVLPSVQLSASQFAGNEGDNLVVTLTRTDGSVGAVTVDITTFALSAAANSDFTPVSKQVVFAPGETTQTVAIQIVNDGDAEADELFGIILTNPRGGAVLGAPSLAAVRINTNDRRDRTGPRITQVLETGPSRGITGFRAVFDEDLNPTRAQDVANYSLFGIGRGGRRTRIALSSAVYDPVTRSVQVTATTPFVQTQFRQLQFRFRGGRSRGLTDVAGNPLRGPLVFNFQLFSGTTVTFRDRDGDRASITIANGGTLDGIRPLGGPRSQRTQFWILDPIPLRSTLSGTVRPLGDGIVVIAEIIGLDKKEFTPLLSNTSFQVNTLTFSSNATGIG